MFAILAEDDSDAESLKVLVRRIAAGLKSKIHTKGFDGCGRLVRKAGKHVRLFAGMGATHFIICHDSDGNNPEVAVHTPNSLYSDFVLL